EAIDIADESAASGENETAVDEIGGKFRRAAFERDANEFHDGVDGVGERFADFLRCDVQRLRETGDGIAAFDFEGQFLLQRGSRADADFDFLGGAFSDEQVVGPLHVIDDRVVNFVAADANAFGENDSGKGNDGDFGGAAADIDDHVGGGFVDRKTDSDRRGHR